MREAWNEFRLSSTLPTITHTCTGSQMKDPSEVDEGRHVTMVSSDSSSVQFWYYRPDFRRAHRGTLLTKELVVDDDGVAAGTDLDFGYRAIRNAR